MQTLEFVGRDMRLLFDTLVAAVEVTRADRERPAVIVNGRQYAPHDLLKVAQLLPDEALSERHQAVADRLFIKRQVGYRRTGSNLASRANQFESDARRSASLVRLVAELTSAPDGVERAP